MNPAAETPITLMGRTIPVVASGDELDRLQRAVALIEEKIKRYREQYNLQEEGYLLRMACLELATALLADADAHHGREAELASRLESLDHRLADELKALGLGR